MGWGFLGSFMEKTMKKGKIKIKLKIWREIKEGKLVKF